MADDEAGVVCGYAKKSKKRNKKPLPFAIAALVDSEDHRSKFITALEKDAKRRRSDGRAEEALVAQFVQVNVDGKEALFDLQTLSLDHLRLLCRNMGLLNCGSLHKFACRKRLAFQQTTTTSLKEQRALPPSLQASQITKNRRDHETNNCTTNQGLRLHASDAHHCLIGTEIAFGSSKQLSGSKRKLYDEDDGSTSSNEESLDDSSSSGKRLKVEEFMSQIVAQGALLVQQMTAFTAMQEKEAEARRKDAEARRKDAEDQAEHRQKEAAIRENAIYFERRLKIALALNDMDELRKLKDEAEKEAK